MMYIMDMSHGKSLTQHTDTNEKNIKSYNKQ